MGEYGFGEPWEWRERKLAALPIEVEWELIRTDLDPKDASLLIYAEVWAQGGDEDRIVACVNALAGLDPAKLAALLEAAQNRSYCDSMAGIGKRCVAPALCSGCQLKAALAELRGTGGGE